MLAAKAVEDELDDGTMPCYMRVGRTLPHALCRAAFLVPLSCSTEDEPTDGMHLVSR